MTDWVSIANSSVAPKAPVTSELVTALRDNTVVSTWEFYDTVYDYTLDGSVSVITSPNFEDGWEYGFRHLNLVQNSGSSNYFVVGQYDEANNESARRNTGSAWASGTLVGGNSLMTVAFPRVPGTSLGSCGGTESDNNINWFTALNPTWSSNETDRVIRNFSWWWSTGANNYQQDGGSFAGGSILMYRRKENISDA